MQLALLAFTPEIGLQNVRFWTQLDAISEKGSAFGRDASAANDDVAASAKFQLESIGVRTVHFLAKLCPSKANCFPTLFLGLVSRTAEMLTCVGRSGPKCFREFDTRVNLEVVVQTIKETIDMEINPRLKKRALMQLRQAVYHQIKLGGFARPLAEIQNLDLHEFFSYVQQISVTADTGMELQEKDLDDFLEA